MTTTDQDYRARYLAARDAWDALHRWVAYHRGATIAADQVLTRMDTLTRHPASSWPHYWSTYCIHDLHDQCRLICKICKSPCRCPCHDKAGQ